MNNNKNIETINAKLVISDVTGTISSVECSDREMNYFTNNGAYLINAALNNNPGINMSEASKKTLRLMMDAYKVNSGEEVVKVINKEIANGSLIPDQMGLVSEIIATAYNTNHLRASHIFKDVPEAFKVWKKNGAGIYTFSNGSAELQMAVLKNSMLGDLTTLVDGYLDTMMFGSKKDSVSYVRVQDKLGVDTKSMLFFSDSEKELNAADIAGCKARLVQRPGNSYVANPNYGRVTDLRTIVLNNF